MTASSGRLQASLADAGPASGAAKDLMTPGQKAMAFALAHPEPGKRGRGNKASCEMQGISKQRLSNARLVLRHSRPLAEAVLAGVIALDGALRTVRKSPKL